MTNQPIPILGRLMLMRSRLEVVHTEIVCLQQMVHRLSLMCREMQEWIDIIEAELAEPAQGGEGRPQ